MISDKNEERKEALEGEELPQKNENTEAIEKNDADNATARSSEEIAQPQKTNGKKKLVSGMFDYLELFAWSVAAVLLLFSFGVRLCRVDGQSMENTLYDKQNLLLYSTAYQPEQGDIVVFHLTNQSMQKTLVKRVIALGGQEVVINTKDKTVTVDGVLYEDASAVLKNRITDEPVDFYDGGLFHYNYDYDSGIFRVTVPEGKVFVLGDNRNNSTDSRSPIVGFVDERCILGKVVLRLKPFTVFS